MKKREDHFIHCPALAFILPGCVYSLYPLYTDSDLVYDSKLEGVSDRYGE